MYFNRLFMLSGGGGGQKQILFKKNQNFVLFVQLEVFLSFYTRHVNSG